MSSAISCLAAAHGLGFPYARGSPERSPASLAAAQVSVGTIEASVLALLFARPVVERGPRSAGAVVILGAGTGIAYVLNWSILRDAGATVATTVTYALPVVAVVAGVVLLGEHPQWYEPVGAAVIVAGALLTQGSWVAMTGLGRRLRPRMISP
jgi:drug/metabolite transporter (DMT)-like permease